MRIRLYFTAALMTVVTVAPVNGQALAAHDTARVETIRRLFAVTEVEAYYAQLINMVRDGYDTIPALASFADARRELYDKLLSFAAIEGDLIAAYREFFTESDAQELIRFYESPTGQRLVRATPELSARMSRVAMERVSAAMPEILRQLGIPPPGR